jgi:diguanylate cyclase (GGDEF)-like protein
MLSSMGSQIGIAINNVLLYKEIKDISLHDPLTGLANRRFLEIQLEKNFEASRRYEEKLSVIMLDIDHFKRYNDTYGHVGGDRLLAKLAAILLKELRTADYVFRYGGEEFLALLPKTDLEKANETAERLRRAVEADAGVTISLGVATYQKNLPDKEALIGRADAALYRAKEGGRNRVEVAGYEQMEGVA